MANSTTSRPAASTQAPSAPAMATSQASTPSRGATPRRVSRCNTGGPKTATVLP
ncbi:hypothetical protein [Nocardia xishanensis]|uniref:hypothetical protein n=1 Tax=Nocardia xishanensis TaxID=238964 RepID=UPI0012F4DA15|nr:hypothetical protein [Nocardia xishanensis]